MERKAHMLARSCLERNIDPRIARAFSRAAAEEEGIAGTPAFEDLLSHPKTRSFLSGSRGGLEPVRRMSAIRGVTVSVSVTFVDSEGDVAAECSWHAGRGIEFRARQGPD